MSKNNFSVIIALAFFLFAFVYYGVFDQKPSTKNELGLSSPAPKDNSWKTYQNKDFNFEIKYPNNWNVAEIPDNELGPIFNFYPQVASDTPPFTHFSELNHVSVYPYGIPTEGISGEYQASFVSLNERPDQAIDFILEDNTPWATYVRFARKPRSWQESGFIFAGTKIIDLKIVCIRDDQPVQLEKCDPFSGDLLTRKGKTDPDIRKIQEIMISSFRFLP